MTWLIATIAGKNENNIHQKEQRRFLPTNTWSVIWTTTPATATATTITSSSSTTWTTLKKKKIDYLIYTVFIFFKSMNFSFSISEISYQNLILYERQQLTIWTTSSSIWTTTTTVRTYKYKFSDWTAKMFAISNLVHHHIHCVHLKKIQKQTFLNKILFFSYHRRRHHHHHCRHHFPYILGQNDLAIKSKDQLKNINEIIKILLDYICNNFLFLNSL